jgi:hypothetical protein
VSYKGFNVRCGCACPECKTPVSLEGFALARGLHYCPACRVYLTPSGTCQERSGERVGKRQGEIDNHFGEVTDD